MTDEEIGKIADFNKWLFWDLPAKFLGWPYAGDVESAWKVLGGLTQSVVGFILVSQLRRDRRLDLDVNLLILLGAICIYVVFGALQRYFGDQERRNRREEDEYESRVWDPQRFGDR